MRSRVHGNGKPHRPVLILSVALWFIGFLLSGASVGAEQAKPAAPVAPPPRATTRTGTDAVTPVEGPSTLRRLGLTIEQTSIGSASWVKGTAPSTGAAAATSTRPRVLTGADIFRVSCQPCHTADGSGALPEVHSIVYPVQSASVTWLTDNARATGQPVDAALIRRQAVQAEAALRGRLRSGGHNMPSFAHLSSDEINVLRPYLDQLAGVRGAAGRQRQITERPARVGELIVKGTCHICHDATNTTNTPATALNGVIPSLATIAGQKTQAQVAQKLREGSLVPLHAGGQPERQGRMPVLGYLSDADIASVYSYLIAYPPK
jgi:mono/diheme cytochrome c family protein